jgi:hypothetical protein
MDGVHLVLAQVSVVTIGMEAYIKPAEDIVIRDLAMGISLLVV